MLLSDLQSYLAFEIEQLKLMEEQIIEVLPEMRDAADHEELKKAIADHLEESKEQLMRLEEIDLTPFSVPADEDEIMNDTAIEAVIDDGRAILTHDGAPVVKDAALIAALQKIEHYEMAAYGCAKAHAHALDEDDMVDILDKNRKEEEASDKKLSTLAEGNWFKEGINELAESLT
jgi:ferritin-like metal-binding protein YciE